eukprot:m51a1_g799 putative inositol hexakisphosphate and diphosphoinositol-pentakisphosphate kinase 2 (914) ;mRNA; f:650120-653481
MVVTIGICCMDVKLYSRPMAAILNRLRRFDDITLVPFGNRCVLEKPVEQWPIVDFLIAFASSGFPLAKAEAYIKLRKPFMINDVLKQHILLDRRLVYKALQDNGIAVPPYEVFVDPKEKPVDFKEKLSKVVVSDSQEEQAIMLSDFEDNQEDATRKSKYWGDNDPLQETDDCITVNGRRFKKPFVEKPVSAEDHNIYIYYPRSSGGGSKRLFRKVGDRSSRFYPWVSTVRRGGSFIYEEFVSTDGADLKVYTVGPDYAHAEARKAPTVDGRVKRTADGKEEISRKITMIFGQNVCGFDILRSDGNTYVCDVNGWSFVKGSPKYYSDCAQILYEIIMAQLHPFAETFSTASLLVQEKDAMLERVPEEPQAPTCGPMTPGAKVRELRCVLAVIRHGDRTPKQKVKVKVSQQHILQFFEGRSDMTAQVKLKSVREMEEFKKAIIAIIEDDKSGLNVLSESVRSSLNEINDVLAENSTFSGINRKVQIKPLEFGPSGEVKRVLLIFKFGGQLTDFGRKQADLLGKLFRHKMYPADRLGMLSLHSSYAHDLKFYASDEGRVQMTAAVFARSFLELDEEEIVPILFALVWNDRRANLLLEHSSSDSELMRTVKKQLATILNSDLDFSEANKALTDDTFVGEVPVGLLRRLGLGRIGNPRRQLHRLRELVQHVCRELQEKIYRATMEGGYASLQRMYKLWSKILATMYDEQADRYDVSKVPDILDCARHDMLHHRASGVNFRTLFDFVRGLANWVVPQEYGITEPEKNEISAEICRPLLQKLISDLRQMRERKQLQTVTRFYFTSESHMQSLMHLLETGLRVPPTAFREENYIAHVVFKMYENMGVPVNDRRRFQVEVWHSTGANSTNVPDPPGDMHSFVLPLRPVAMDLALDSVISSFEFVCTPPTRSPAPSPPGPTPH